MATQYQQAKADLKEFKKSIQEECRNDKPKERMLLNNYTDYLAREPYMNLTEYKINLLQNYCSKLHP